MAAMAAALIQGGINCGGHYADSCMACPQGNGREWCNGECMWVSSMLGVSGQCIERLPIVGGAIPDSGRNNMHWYYLIVGITGLLMFIFAAIYKVKVVNKIGIVGKYFNPHARERGIFECFADTNTCLHVAFCLPVVAGKNYAATETTGFWPGCVLTFLGTYSPFYLFNVLIRAILTGMVQRRTGGEHTFCQNLLFNLFCYPCEIGRESMEVDTELGAEIRCCMHVHVAPKIVTEAANVSSRFCGPGTRACS